MISEITEREPERNEGLVESMHERIDSGVITVETEETQQLIRIDWNAVLEEDSELEVLFRTQPYESLYNAELAAQEHIDLGEEETIDQRIRIENYDETNAQRIDETVSRHIDTLVTINCNVDQIYPKQPITTEAVFQCLKCGVGTLKEQSLINEQLDEPYHCLNEDCKNTNKSKFVLQEETLIDRQIIKLSDDPTPDRQGEEIDAQIINPFLDEVEVGERVTVKAIPVAYREQSNDQTKKVELLVLGIESGRKSYDLTEEDKEKFDTIIEEGRAEEVLTRSLAPDIVGEDIERFKKGVLYALLSGNVDWLDRPSLNISGIGDPSTGKSRVIKQASEKVAESKLAEAGGSTSAGLLGTVERDERTGKWYAVQGAAIRYRDLMIDELADIDNNDLQKLKPFLSEREYRLTKAGVDKEFKTDGAVISASNPIDGDFNEFEPLSEQFGFAPEILSRFDLIYTISDTPNNEEDRAKAGAMVDSMLRSSDKIEDVDTLSDEEFGKFVEYLRQLKPEPTGQVKAYIQEVFADLRNGNETNDSFIDTRKIETIFRVAISEARLNGHETLTTEDIDTGVEMLIESLNQLEEYNIDKSAINSGESTYQSEVRRRVLEVVKVLDEVDDVETTKEEIIQRVADAMDDDPDEIQETVEHYIKQHRESGSIIAKDDGTFYPNE